MKRIRNSNTTVRFGNPIQAGENSVKKIPLPVSATANEMPISYFVCQFSRIGYNAGEDVIF